MNRTTRVTAFLAAAQLLAIVNNAPAASVSELRCEFRRDPMGLDVEKPRLSCLLREKRRHR